MFASHLATSSSFDSINLETTDKILANVITFLDRKRTLLAANSVNKKWKNHVDARNNYEVVIYIWLPGNARGGKVGHIALETFTGNVVNNRKGIYVSFWPKGKVSILNIYIENSSFFSPSIEEDMRLEGDQPPDHILSLYNCNPRIIHYEFRRFQHDSWTENWSLNNAIFFNMGTVFHNRTCAGIIGDLLFSSGNNDIKSYLKKEFPGKYIEFHPNQPTYLCERRKSYWYKALLTKNPIELSKKTLFITISGIILNHLIFGFDFFGSLSAIETLAMYYTSFKYRQDNILTPASIFRALKYKEKFHKDIFTSDPCFAKNLPFLKAVLFSLIIYYRNYLPSHLQELSFLYAYHMSDMLSSHFRILYGSYLLSRTDQYSNDSFPQLQLNQMKTEENNSNNAAINYNTCPSLIIKINDDSDQRISRQSKNHYSFWLNRKTLVVASALVVAGAAVAFSM